MKKATDLANRITLGLGILLLVVSAGCLVPVGGGGYDGDVVVPGPPDVFLFGGGYDRGRDVHAYSRRGFASRAAAHPGGGHAAPHGGGGGGDRRR
jgi:hypothetical protein